MLRRHTKAPEKRRIAAWDLEWIPANERRAREHGFKPLELRLCGVYDGMGYRAYRTMGTFLDGELTPEHSGTWYYAHAGGLYDLSFVFDFILTRDPDSYHIDAAFSGSSAIIVKITKGDHHWYFIDSFWLMRTNLRNIAEMIGMQKGGEDGSIETFYAPFHELMAYNEQDCKILYRAILYFEEAILSLGGQLEKTVASSALKLFRMAYLKSNIRTSAEVNAMARNAYVASRVEVFSPKVRDARYWDINSSFPYAMTQPAPGNYLGRQARLPTRADALYVARCEIEVPDMYLPPLPVRSLSGRVFFPVGKWKGWFSNVHLEMLERAGGRIVKVFESRLFEPFYDMANYAIDIYDRRKNTSDEGLKQVLKILLNALYGKFAEAERKGRVVINPKREFFEHPEAEPGGTGRRYLMPNVWELIEDKEIPHAHVPLSMHITALAMKNLDGHMRQSKRVHYCDTDGFCTDDDEVFPTSNELGGLKLEKELSEGIFAAPKLYAMRAQGKDEWMVKAKGFSRIRDPDDPDAESRRLKYEDFTALLEGREVYVETFARIRQNLKAGKTAPREYLQKKQLRGTLRPKRQPRPDGSTWPWHVDHIAGD